MAVTGLWHEDTDLLHGTDIDTNIDMSIDSFHDIFTVRDGDSHHDHVTAFIKVPLEAGLGTGRPADGCYMGRLLSVAVQGVGGTSGTPLHYTVQGCAASCPHMHTSRAL